MIYRGPIADLSAVQRDLLAVLVREQQSDRFALKQHLSQDRKRRITNSKIYDELGRLCDDGLVEKHSAQFARDETNKYRITRDGLKTLAAHRNWLDDQLADGPPVCMGVNG